MLGQTNLSHRTDFDESSYVEHYESFFGAADSDRLFAALTAADVPWEQQAIRGVLTRRSNVWYANDPRFIYRYSGQTWTPHPFTPVIAEIRERLEVLCGCALNCALGALYPDGQAGVSWHDDNDFPDFPDTPIVTVSFGSERRFKARRKSDHEVVAQYDITQGSVLVMGGRMQHDYEHAIMKTSRKVGPRVNFSYRMFHIAE